MKKITTFFALIITYLSLAQFYPGMTGYGGGFPGFGGGFPSFGGGRGTSTFHAPENWIPDSVPLRIKMYQASDLDFYYIQDVDTATFRHFELLPPKEKFNDVWLGNVAYPWLPNDFSLRVKYQYQDFYFLNPFMDRIFTENTKFYFRTNRPYTDLYYSASIKETEQQVLKALHTQNINYYKNFGISYNLYTAREYVARRDNSSVNSLIFWFANEKQKFRYTFNAFLNSIKLLETGGFVDTTYQIEYNNIYLTEAKTHIGYRGINIDPEYLIFKKGDSIKISAYSIISFSRHTHSYYDPNIAQNIDFYGQAFFDQNFTYDSVSYDKFKIDFGLKYISKLLKLNLSFSREVQAFYYFKGYIFKPKTINYSSNAIILGINDLNISNFFILDAKATYYFTGRKIGQTQAYLNIYKNFKLLQTKLSFQYLHLHPDYFLTFYRGNTDIWFNLYFNYQTFTNAKFAILFKPLNLNLETEYWNIQNYITFSSGVPVQYALPGNVFIFRLKNSINLGFIHIDNQFTYQQTNQQIYFNLPQFMTFSSLWIDFKMFKKALEVQLGTDLYYVSKFWLYQYRPTVEAFYFYTDRYTGNMPIANIFANFRRKQLTMFFKFEFVNYFLHNIPFYATVEHYHYPVFYYRFGARWWFKN